MLITLNVTQKILNEGVGQVVELSTAHTDAATRQKGRHGEKKDTEHGHQGWSTSQDVCTSE